MKLFYTNSSAKEEIAKLETQVSTLDADAVAAATENSKLTGELATANESILDITTERDEAIAAFEASEKTATKATADLATANAKLATFDADVENAAQAKFAGLGGDPIAASREDDKFESLSREAFNALDPSDRMAHVKAGGKIA